MDEFHGFLFMDNSDRSKYGTLLSGLETQHNLGNDQYPKTLVDAHTVLANHTFDKAYYNNKDKKRRSDHDKERKTPSSDTPKLSLSFNQVKKKGPCHCCGETHALTDCP